MKCSAVVAGCLDSLVPKHAAKHLDQYYPGEVYLHYGNRPACYPNMLVCSNLGIGAADDQGLYTALSEF